MGSFETALPSRDDGRPAVSRTMSGRADNPRLSACGFVDAPSAPRGVWRVGYPLGVARTAGRRCVAPIPVQGDGPRAAPSAFPTVEATQSGPTGRGLLFGCRRDSIAAASETPVRERCDSLHRPGGNQSNRQFLPLLGGLPPDAGRHKRWESGANVYGAYPRPEGRGFAPIFHVTIQHEAVSRHRGSRQLQPAV